MYSDAIKIFKCREVKTPERGTKDSAGIDFFIPTDLKEDIMIEKMKTTQSWPIINYDESTKCVKSIIIKSGQSVLLPSGIHINLDTGYCMELKNKSGVAAKKHAIVGSNIVDCDYEGEIHINLHNVGADDIIISAGEKIVQGLIYKVEMPTVKECLSKYELYFDKQSSRGSGGFGSTDKK